MGKRAVEKLHDHVLPWQIGDEDFPFCIRRNLLDGNGKCGDKYALFSEKAARMLNSLQTVTPAHPQQQWHCVVCCGFKTTLVLAWEGREVFHNNT